MDDDSDTSLPWQDKRYRFPKSYFLAHAIAHGTEHRTEIKIALAASGVDSPDPDAWGHSDAAGYGQEITE